MYEVERLLKFYPAVTSDPEVLSINQPDSEGTELADRVPPPELMQYASKEATQYLRSGTRDAQTVMKLLQNGGYRAESGRRFLEFGCANARVLRHFQPWAEAGEGWGVDINSAPIHWCQQNLSPPFHFAVSTTAPHLFFEDRYFDFVFCMSVFTHIDDLMMSWLLELRRIIQSGGYLVATFHDEKTCEYIDSHPGRPLAKSVAKFPQFRVFRESEMQMISLGRDWHSQVFYKRAYLQRTLGRYFELVDIAEKTMGGHQSMYLLRKR